MSCRGIYEYALEGRWRGTNMPWRGEVSHTHTHTHTHAHVGEMSVELSTVRLVYMKEDLKHTVDMQEVWNSEETAMHKQNFLARKQVGTRMDTSAKRQG